MTGNILSYLEDYGGYSFREKPMNHVDSLVLCQLSYLKFEGLVTDTGDQVSLRELTWHPAREGLFADERYEKVNRELFWKAAGSIRYGGTGLGYFVSLTRKGWETQFCAVTFFPEGEAPYVAFRGTDESIVGWKEDFNMAFQSPVPGQQFSVDYLNIVGEKLTGSFYVGGHSKGGNLAVYSAIYCRESIRRRILRVYNMDGPGFRASVLEASGYQQIADRILKLLPPSSLVGMLFEQEMEYRVVESKGLGLLQHDPFSWIVEKDHFVPAQGLDKRRKAMDETLNAWLLSLDQEELKVLVDTVFYVVTASRAEDLNQWSEHAMGRMALMAAAVKEVDPEDKKVIRKALGELFELAGRQAVEKLGRYFSIEDQRT